jgi:hypothetical protein
MLQVRIVRPRASLPLVHGWRFCSSRDSLDAVLHGIGLLNKFSLWALVRLRHRVHQHPATTGSRAACCAASIRTSPPKSLTFKLWASSMLP